MGDKTNKLNICLIKNEHTRFNQIIDPDTTSFDIDGVGTFYMEDSHPKAPDWLKDFFGGRLKGKLRLVTSTAKGVLLVRIRVAGKSHMFAIVFGYGRSLLNEGVIEDRFGLKVVLNTVDPKSLRSIDKTTLGSVPKQSREQVSREGVAANFGIDIEQDLLNAVTGKSQNPNFGRTISGRDALSAAVKVDISNIAGFLELCFRQYESDAYKAEFGWIDQIKEIRDPVVLNDLNAQLVENIKKNDFDKTWMAPPEVLDWVDVKGFRYARPKRADIKPDLDLAEFLKSIDSGKVDLDLLKQTTVHVISAKTEESMMHWSAYRCIYAEIDYKDRVCVLNDAKWYEITKDFSAEVNSDFKSIPDASISLPVYAHADEGAYNVSLPGAVPNSHCMDREMILVRWRT